MSNWKLLIAGCLVVILGACSGSAPGDTERRMAAIEDASDDIKAILIASDAKLDAIDDIDTRLDDIEDAVGDIKASMAASDAKLDAMDDINTRLADIEDALNKLEDRQDYSSQIPEAALPTWREGTTTAEGNALLLDCLRTRFGILALAPGFEEAILPMIDGLDELGSDFGSEADAIAFTGVIFGCWQIR